MPALSSSRYCFAFAARPLNVPHSRWKNAFFGCNSRNSTPRQKVLLCQPIEATRRSKSCFRRHKPGICFEPTAAADEVSVSSDAIVFRGLRLRLGRGGARTSSAKASRRLRSCKKSVRPGLSTGWPERLRRSLKRSCHAPAIGPPEKGRNSAGPSAQMRACGCGFTGSYRNIQRCPGPALAVTNAGTSSGWTGR